MGVRSPPLSEAGVQCASQGRSRSADEFPFQDSLLQPGLGLWVECHLHALLPSLGLCSEQNPVASGPGWF